MAIKNNRICKPSQPKSDLNRARLLSHADSVITEQSIQFTVFDGQNSKMRYATSWIGADLIKAASQKLWLKAQYKPINRVKATFQSWKMFTKWLSDGEDALDIPYPASRACYQLGEYLDLAKFATEWEIHELEDQVISRILSMFTDETTREQMNYRDVIEEFMVLLDYCESGTFWAEDSIAVTPSQRARARICDWIEERWDTEQVNLRFQHVEGYRKCLVLLVKQVALSKTPTEDTEEASTSWENLAGIQKMSMIRFP